MAIKTNASGQFKLNFMLMLSGSIHPSHRGGCGPPPRLFVPVPNPVKTTTRHVVADTHLDSGRYSRAFLAGYLSRLSPVAPRMGQAPENWLI